MDWNVILTVAPGRGNEHGLLGALAHLGRFRPTAYRYVCMGWVQDMAAFLEAIHEARAAGRPWSAYVGRVVPIEHVFSFAPESLAAQMKAAVAAFVPRLSDGSFCVRVERRGLAGRVSSRDVEREVADHVHALAAAQGKAMRTALEDPDFVIAGETLGGECGVALLPRELRQRFSFIQTR
jgi:tRNA(Ser,Leu) C12 N-acetylase TAN1